MIIQFPIKREIKLTEEQEKRIELFAIDFIGLLNDLCDEMDVETANNEELGEIIDLVVGKMLTTFGTLLNNEDET